MQTKPALVFLCQRIPYPPDKGERITSFNLLRYLVRHYRVFVGTFIDDPRDRASIEPLRAMVEDLHVDEISKPWAFAEAFPRWLLGDPISFALFRSSGLGRWLEQVEMLHQPVAVVTHSSNISAYAVDRFRRKQVQEPVRILHFADVDSEKFVAYAQRSRGPKRWLLESEARRVRREERRLTAGADHVAFVSDEEAELFRTAVLEMHRDRVVTLPNGVDSEVFDRKKYPDAPFKSHGAVLMFTGAMDYPPNVEAVGWFAKHVFPEIRKTVPYAQFFIVGSKPAPSVKALAEQENITVTGRVDSVAAYLAHANVAVAPLKIARGIQNKVLEALSMGLPTVVSSGALTGIAAEPGKHLLCADEPEEWTKACLELLSDHEKAAHLGAAARDLAVTLYDWDAQFDRLRRLIEGGKRLATCP